MDLINRQAAIDVVDSETVSTNPDLFKSSKKFISFMDDSDISSFGNWQWSNGFNTALTAVVIDLKKLPSAQPEPSQVARDIATIIENEKDMRVIAAQPEPKWIPVSERLPKDGERVLCTHLGGINPNRQVIEHIYEGGQFVLGWEMDMNPSSPTFMQRYMGKVVAWMPLPSPYREDGGERRTDD